MRGLRSTVGPGDEFRTIMACHGSACGAERPCTGYVAREGWSNLAIRIAAIAGRIDYEACLAAVDGVDLWPNFDAMLSAYEEALEP